MLKTPLGQSALPLYEITCTILNLATCPLTQLFMIHHISNFIPGAGKLTYLRTPTPSADIRVETGIEQGSHFRVWS